MRILEGEMGDDQDVGKAVRVQVEAKVEKKQRKEQEKAEKERRLVESETALRTAIQVSHSPLLSAPTAPRADLRLSPPQASGARLPKGATKKLFEKCPVDVTPPHFDPDALPSESLSTLPLLPPLGATPAQLSAFTPWVAPPAHTPLIFPVFLLLPLASPPTRDLCLEFHVLASFGDVLAFMEHDPASFQIYIATVKGKVLKVGAKLLLGKVLQATAKEQGDGWDLKEGWALEMVAVPKGPEGEKWIEGWKEEVKKGVGAIL